VEEPIYRAGAWWLQRADGHWIYWNVRRDAWDFHPYGPPVVSPPAQTPELPKDRSPPPPPAGYAPPPGPPSPAYETSREKPPPPPSPPGPAPPFPGATPVQAPVPPQWPDPGHPAPMPQPYTAVPYVPKPKPAPVWAAGPVVFAGWWQRTFAILVDLLVVGGPTVLVLAIVDAAMAPGSFDPFTNEIDESTRSAAMVVALALCYIVFVSAYFALSNGGEAGATVGKRLMRIRVVDQHDGNPIGPGRALLRWVLTGVFWVSLYLPGLLNLLWPLWDPQRQAWHDKLANSVVVTAPR